MTDVVDTAAVIALGVSVVAAVPAFVGLSQARRANKVASGANDLAAQANRIALNADELSRRTEARAVEPMTWNGLSGGPTSTTSSSPTRGWTLHTTFDSVSGARGVRDNMMAPRSSRRGRTLKCPAKQPCH